MERKNDVNGINLDVSSVRHSYPVVPYYGGGVVIRWTSDIGFGEYFLYYNSEGILCADSERMDSAQDKAFLYKLFEVLVDNIKITN